MRKYIYGIMSLFILIACGSSSEKYKIEDDGNGTRSPRISKVIESYYDYDIDDENKTNLTEQMTAQYYYTKENMLDRIEEEAIDSIEVKRYNTRYLYNQRKQIVSIAYESISPMGKHEGKDEFTYGNLIYAKTKTPAIISSQNYSSGYGENGEEVLEAGAKFDYEYEYNYKGEATKLLSTNGTTYTYNFQDKIVVESYGGDKYKEYTYNSFGKLDTEYTNSRQSNLADTKIKYFYNNKGLLLVSEEYKIEGDGIEYLIQKNEYFYENKPYYLNPSPSDLDQGQYSSSGIY